MSRVRTVSLAVAAAAAVAGAGFLVSPAGAAPVLASATGTPTPTTSSPTTPPPTTPPPTTTAPTTTAPTTTPPPTTPPPGQEGCTPGFWKNHPEAFAGTGFTASTTVGSVFTSLAGTSAGDLTFEQALSQGGGELNALLRQAVAALLNASSPEVDYPLDAATVIDLTNAAVTSGQFEATKDVFDQFNNLEAAGFCD